MNFDFAGQINPYLERLNMAGAIAFGEGELDRLRPSVDYDASSQEETGTVFSIEGYEKVQRAFEAFDNHYNREEEDARDWCEQIIIARYMELVRAAQLSAKANEMAWDGVPIYFTEHAYDFVVFAPGVGR